MAEKVTLEVIDEKIIALLGMAERQAEKRDPKIWAMMEDAVHNLIKLRNQYNVPNPQLEEAAQKLFPINAVQEWLDEN